MRNFKLTLAYDGAPFHGWQIQPGVATVQGVLTEVIRQITQEHMSIHGASRTDAGVHALGQVASFKTQSLLPEQELQRAMNALLPPAIRVMQIEETGPDFHARWQSEGKTYQYRTFRGRILSPFEHGRVLHYPHELDVHAMQRAAQLFAGEHDFTSFSASSGTEESDRDRSPLKTIFCSEILDLPEKEELAYEVSGRSFLRYMVRKIVGTLFEVGRCKLRVEDIPAIFEARDRSLSGPTLPPEGLYLISVKYPEPWKIG